MGRIIIASCLFLAACGGSVDAPSPACAPSAVDAAPDAPREASAVDAGPEAAAPVDASADVADGGGLLCCSTGQNLLVCDPGQPWTCGYTATHPGLCTDPGCSVGDTCQGFNGPGVVVICGR